MNEETENTLWKVPENDEFITLVDVTSIYLKPQFIT